VHPIACRRFVEGVRTPQQHVHQVLKGQINQFAAFLQTRKVRAPWTNCARGIAVEAVVRFFPAFGQRFHVA